MGKTIVWKKVSFINCLGLKLAGLLCPGPDTDTVVIVCHGFTGSKEGGGKAIAMAEEIRRRGYASLLFDFSGCGESEGNFAGVSLTNHVNDISSSVDYCLGLGYQRILTLGRSFGGAAVLCHCGFDKRVAGVCAWAAPANPARLFTGFIDTAQETINDLVPLTGDRGTVFVKRSFFDDLNKHDVLKHTGLIAPRPLLVVHGSDDAVVPAENAQAVFNAAGTPKDIHIIQGADHQFSAHYQKAWAVVFDWLAKHFTRAK